MNVDLLIKANKELSEEMQRYKEMWFIANNSLAKYRNIEKQIGCSLEVRCNVFYDSTIYNCLGYKMTVKETYGDHFIAVIENDIFSFDYKDHKKTWWLKENHEE